jgi:hypothetical protein
MEQREEGKLDAKDSRRSESVVAIPSPLTPVPYKMVYSNAEKEEGTKKIREKKRKLEQGKA